MALPGIAIQGTHYRTDKRTMRALAEAERLGGPLTPTQGSWSTAVKVSGSTHAGGGVIDFSVRGLTMTQINRRVKALRTVGIWCWYRPEIPGVWGPHIHAVCVGCPSLSPAAERQIAAARRGRDGLAGNGLDRHRDMKLPVITFEQYCAKTGLMGGRVLAQGDHGHDVRKLQRKLGIVVDGRFGPQTAKAVAAYQKQHGLDPNGRAGAVMVKKLFALAA